MTGATECPYCHTPGNGLVCADDTSLALSNLADVPWLLEQLAITATRQSVTGRSSGSTSQSAVAPLPINLAAADVLARLVTTVTAWATALGASTVEDRFNAARSEFAAVIIEARDIDEEEADAAARRAAVLSGLGEIQDRMADLGQQLLLLADTGPGTARWLAARPALIRADPQAGRHIAALLDLTASPTTDSSPAGATSRTGLAWTTIDLPVEMVPIGECGGQRTLPGGQAEPCACSCHNGPGHTCDLPGGCGSEGCSNGWRQITATITCTRWLSVEPGQPAVTCPNCATIHDVRARRSAVLDDVPYVQGRAHHLAGILTAMGIRCTPAMIRDRAHRGRLQPTFEDPEGHRWYRLGDVRESLLPAPQQSPVLAAAQAASS